MAEVRIGGAPTDIAIAQGRAWVPSAATGELTAIDDRAAPAVAATYASSAGALRLSSDGFSVWLAGAARRRPDRPSTRCSAGEAARRTIGVGGAPSTWQRADDGVWVSNGSRAAR